MLTYNIQINVVIFKQVPTYWLCLY